ncbi:MAG: hypothetical protein KDJ14_03465 [Xanthomonadales bacterium]|nr:hypothetical protein [Xanthomonadales bacterium]
MIQIDEAGARRGARISAERLVLLGTLLPLGYKAFDYALIGSIVPLLCWVLGVSLVFGALRAKSLRWRRRCVATWAVLLMLWAIARLVVFVLHLTLGIPEAHVAGQMNAFYLAVSLAHLIVAIWLLARRTRIAEQASAVAGAADAV